MRSIPRAKGHHSFRGMTSRRFRIYDGTMLPRTCWSDEDRKYHIDVDVTWRDRAVQPIDVRSMTCKPRHSKIQSKEPLRSITQELIAA